MKLARAFAFLIILGSTAVAAHAQTGTDPVIYTKDPPICSSPTLLSTNTLSVDYSTNPFPLCFENNTANPFDSFDLVFTDVPTGTNFECFTNIWTDCTQSSVSSGLNLLTVTFDMFDQPISMPTSPQPCFANDGTGGDCPGFLGADGVAQTTQTPTINETPEPNSIILFGSGLVLFFAGAKLRLRART